MEASDAEEVKLPEIFCDFFDGENGLIVGNGERKYGRYWGISELTGINSDWRIGYS